MLPSQPVCPFLLQKEAVKKTLHRRIHGFEKAVTNAKDSLEKSLAYKEAAHTAELVKMNYSKLKKGMKDLIVSDWMKENQEVCIPIDPKLSPKEVLERLFKKSKKMQRAIEPLRALVIRLTGEYEACKQALAELEAIDCLDALNALKKRLKIADNSLQKKESSKQKPYHTFYSEKGFMILVGKNSQSNHVLTFQVAHGKDLWLHAHSVSGAHVVIRQKGDQEFDAETLQDAMQLALFHSKAKNTPHCAHEVLVTEQKYVSRTASMSLGKVLVSKHKILMAMLDPERVKKIKARNSNSL